MRVNNVEKVFNDISKEGNSFKASGSIWGLPILAPACSAHIQGMSAYKDYIILTHNSENKNAKFGSIIAVNRKSKKILFRVDTPEEGYNHPGGCQIEQENGYLALSLEPNGDKNKSSVIRFYDLKTLIDNKLCLLPTTIKRDDRKAGAVGITSRVENGKKIFYVVVIDNGMTDVYKSNGLPLEDPNCRFEMVFGGIRLKYGGDNISLITDISDKIYMLGFRTENLGTLNKDLSDLYLIDCTEKKINHISSRHFITKHARPGALGVHFRYGAGVEVESEDKINLLVSERNYVSNNIEYNVFS